MPLRVLILDDYQDVARELGPWHSLGFEVDLDVRTTHLTDAQLRAALAPAEVVVVMRERTPLPREALEHAPNVKLVVTTGMANASIDLAACRERGIEVRGSRGSSGATAELAWGLILALVRDLPANDRRVRGGGWQGDRAADLGGDLAGARLGVVGLGRLGTAVATVGLAFGMDVVAWSQNLTAQQALAVGVRAVAKAELFSTSDIVSVHLKLSERSRGVVGADEIAMMKPTAYLVNTARGPLIDEEALIGALREGRIAGAGLDVFDVEPLPPGHPLRSSPNTVLTPHVGYVTRATYEAWWRDVVDDVAAWARGEETDPPRRLA